MAWIDFGKKRGGKRVSKGYTFNAWGTVWLNDRLHHSNNAHRFAQYATNE